MKVRLLCNEKRAIKTSEQREIRSYKKQWSERVSSTPQVYQGHTLEKTYLGEDFFWAITPTAGDYILFKFDRPVSIER